MWQSEEFDLWWPDIAQFEEHMARDSEGQTQIPVWSIACSTFLLR